MLDAVTRLTTQDSDDPGTDTSSDDTDRELPPPRGRRTSSKVSRQEARETVRKKRQQLSPSRRLSPAPAEYIAEQAPNCSSPQQISFTRSRSPHIRPGSVSNNGMNSQTGTAPLFVRHKPSPIFSSFLPAVVSAQFCIPLLAVTVSFSADSRSLAESALLLGSLLIANRQLARATGPLDTSDFSVSLEIDILLMICIAYIMWTHTSLSRATTTPSVSDEKDEGRLSPKTESRENKRNGGTAASLVKPHFGFVWMSVPKNFRPCSDDGASTGLSLPPLIAVALLSSAVRKAASPDSGLLPRGWLIEAPRVLTNGRSPLSALEALILSRRGLIDYASLSSFILVVQILASSWYEARYRRRRSVPEGERGSVPRKEMRRTWLYSAFALVLALVVLCLRFLLARYHIGIWQNISYYEIIIGTIFYQFCLYVALRLAHGGFTLGELAVVSFGGLALGTELLGLTRTKIWPKTTPFIKTYRLPTPLLIFQIALIGGSLVTGFLLSPLLVLSRHIAQRPVRRLRFPREKPKHRRALAAGFYFGTVVIVVGLVGSWTWWNLGRRDPWIWIIFWILEGKKKWTRPLLLAYWLLLGSISVAGWNRQLSRSRKYRPRNTSTYNGENIIIVPVAATQSQKSAEGVPPTLTTGGLGISFPNLPNGTQVATDLLDAADKHVPTLGVNARRKFFHGLAVAMFLPGVAIDPAFTHLSFSAAFALFIFAEYVRYFAIYPFGAPVHLFMNEFLDHKDSGTAILSHFYLLTGCAGSIWLEGPSRLHQYTGILALGVGDALASIVGKRIGKHRWFAGSPKTVEGSIAFVVSIIMCASLLRIFGLVDDFSMTQYAGVVTLAAAFEGFSDQNDNLTLPLYMWSMLVVVGV
ncbi:hypothetical protein V8B97DRAFT_1868302 [Scleroderma yunnanense]